MIKNEFQYMEALTIASKYFDADDDSYEAYLRDIIVDEIVAYEDVHFPIDMVAPE